MAKKKIAPPTTDQYMIFGEPAILRSRRTDNPLILLHIATAEDDSERYVVEYSSSYHVEFVYCPRCKSQMFRNMIVESGLNSQDHRCRRCKSYVKFLFGTGASKLLPQLT
jgi:hypothetical protein